MDIRRAFSQSRPALLLAALLALPVAAVLALYPQSAEAQQPPEAPSPPTLTRTDGTVTAEWDAVSGAAKYHASYSTDGGAGWQAPVDDHWNITATRITFAADNAKTCVVGVRAGNEHVWSAWRNSEPSGPWTPPEPTPAPTATPTTEPTIAPTPAPTAAPTPTPSDPSQVSVSNLGQTGTNHWCSARADWRCAQGFTTGGNANGYVRGLSANTAYTCKAYRDAQCAQYIAEMAGTTTSPPSPSPAQRGVSAQSQSSNPPAAPQKVYVYRVCGGMTVGYHTIPGATGYNIEHSGNNGKQWNRAVTNQNHNWWGVNVSNQHVTWLWRLQARNAYGASGWTESGAAPPPP